MELHIDGFDKYGPIGLTDDSYPSLADLLAQEYNNVIVTGSGTLAVVEGLAGLGQAVQLQHTSQFSQVGIRKTLPDGPESRLIGGFFFTATGGLYGSGGIQFFDQIGNAIQCSINIMGNGTIALTRGDFHDYSSELVEVSGASILDGQENSLAFDIEIGNAGAYSIWLNGVEILNGTGDTQSTANANCTDVTVATASQSGGATLVVDHLWLANTTATGISALITTDPLVETTLPTADTVDDDFIKDSIVVGSPYSLLASAGAVALAANTMALQRVTPEVAVTLNEVRVTPAATDPTQKFKAVVYDSSWNLLSDGTEVVGCVASTQLVLPLATPQALTAATTYYIGFYSDTTRSFWLQDASAIGYSIANTYVSGAAAGPIAPAVDQNTFMLFGVGDTFVDSWAAVNETTPDGDLGYVSSAVVADRNLYEMAPLTLIPETIFTVCTKALVRKSDTGTRLFNLLVDSNATVSEGDRAAQTVGTSYTWLGSFQTLNPDGDIAWLEAAHNAATHGFEIDT